MPGAGVQPSADPLADYPHSTPVQTRWKDNDVYGHVNNVEYYSYFDTVINAWLVTAGGLDVARSPVIGVCAESHCEFRSALTFPEPVTAFLRVDHLSRSSARYGLALAARGSAEAAAVGWFVHVFVDRTTRRPVEIPAPLRGALERLRVPGAGTPHPG